MVRPGYKMTELGEIPEEWEVKKLKTCLKVISGYAFKSIKFKEHAVEESYQVLRIGNVTTRGLDINKNQVFLNKVDLENNELNYLLKQGDTLISLTGTVNKRDYGNVAYVSESDKYLLNQRVACSRVNEKVGNEKYFYYAYQIDLFRDQFFILGEGGTGNQANVSSKDLLEIIMPFPPLQEQKQIAEILSSADDAIAKTEEIIEKTKQVKKGLMQQLLTKGIDHTKFKMTELGEIPEEWETVNLEGISQIIMGQSPSSSSYNDCGEGIAFFQGKEAFGVVNPSIKKWTTEPTKISLPLDILISVRAPVGDVNINNVESCIGRGLAGIRVSGKASFNYVYYLLQAQKSRLQINSQGSTFEAINSGDLREFKISLPPLQEQHQIASILSSVDEKIEALEKRKAQLEQTKKGLMQDLLTGKVRVTSLPACI